MEQFLRLPVVIEKCSMASTTIYRKIKEGTFPAPVKLSARSSAWKQSEIEDWMNERIAERDNLIIGGV